MTLRSDEYNHLIGQYGNPNLVMFALGLKASLLEGRHYRSQETFLGNLQSPDKTLRSRARLRTRQIN